MAKQAIKMAIPVILTGVFAIIVFLATNHGQLAQGFYIVVLMFIIFMVFFGIAMGQALSSPTKKLLNSAKELTRGNVYTRANIDTKDELSELAEAFNKIAGELQKSQEQRLSLEKSVGIKVKARTQELEETIKALEQKVRNRTIELERLIKEVNQLQVSAKNNNLKIIPPKKQ